MITAKNARDKSLSANNGKIQEILTQLAVQITRATERGQLDTSINLLGLSNEQQDIVRQEVNRYGYTTEIQKYDGDYREPSYTCLLVKW